MYVKAAEVAEITGVSKSKAYKIIAQLNDELKAKNYMVISGRVPQNTLWKKSMNKKPIDNCSYQ